MCHQPLFGPNERIIEFAGTESDHAGLISFRLMPNGELYVDVYRQGAKVKVHVTKPEEPTK